MAPYQMSTVPDSGAYNLMGTLKSNIHTRWAIPPRIHTDRVITPLLAEGLRGTGLSPL